MIVIRDNKEKVGYWNLDRYDDCDTQVCEHLETGDYQLYNSKKIVIERKKTTGEISINLGSKYKQFCAECERMAEFENRYIICEFGLDTVLEFPKNSGIPLYKQRYLRMSGNFILKRINEIEDKYNVKFLFCNNKEEAELTALRLLKENSI